MLRKIYLSGIEKRPGKSFISLGFLSILKEQEENLHCFKLFSEKNDPQLPLLETLCNHTVQPLMDVTEAMALMRMRPNDLSNAVFEVTQEKDKHKLTYFEGSDFKSDNDIFEYQFNLTLAYQLNCDVILVVSAKDRTLPHTLSLLKDAFELARQQHARIHGVIINRVAEESSALSFFQKHLKELAFVAVVPEFDGLANPSVLDISKHLNAAVLCGQKELNRPVRSFTIAAKTVRNFLETRLDRNDMLIITPDDRVDILLGSLLADQSAHYPKIAGIVLTGGEMLGPIIQQILTGLEEPFPVLLTKLKTYETATALFSANFSLSSNDLNKVSKAIDSMRPYFLSSVTRLLRTKPRPLHLTPSVFLYDLSLKAKKSLKHIVLPEGDDTRILMAADYLLKRNIVKITLLGDEKKIHFLAKRLDLTLPHVSIIHLKDAKQKERYTKKYFNLRQHKNVNISIATERMDDPNYFATMMVYCGDADGMVSGATHTTANTIRPALEIIKTKPNVEKVSSVFIMCLPTRVLIYGDCAINPEPDSHVLAEIALQAAHITKKLGLKPKVALLSYSSGSSGTGKSVDKVTEALTIIKKRTPSLLVEGPLQYDAAVDADVAHKKMPHSVLAGNANVLIFPDLNTGNNTYKAVQRETGSLAIGPILLGLNKPVNDLSRGCSVEDVINTILITAIQV